MSWLGIIGSRGGEREDALDKCEGVVHACRVLKNILMEYNISSKM